MEEMVEKKEKEIAKTGMWVLKIMNFGGFWHDKHPNEGNLIPINIKSYHTRCTFLNPEHEEYPIEDVLYDDESQDELEITLEKDKQLVKQLTQKTTY